MTRGAGATRMSATLQRVIARSPVPVLLVSRSRDAVAMEPPIRRIAVPSLGTRSGRAAQDIAFAVAERSEAQVHAVHVVTTDAPAELDPDGGAWRTSGDDALAGSADIAARFGQTAALTRTQGTTTGRELLRHADDVAADLIVFGVEPLAAGDRAFLGYDAEHVLERARQTVALIILPA
jgi:nucleotide-binding universal stress UspA family protein